ncbi:MAG: BatD family protein, partial [Nitrospinota bacterium]|nr:BatD family protein [Nitrospinota bacterium]
EPAKPDFGAMKAVGQSSSQSVSIVNMSMKISKTITYQLIAPDEGEHTILPVTVVYDGQTYRSGPVTITVDPSAQPPAAGPSGRRGGLFADPFGAAPAFQPRARADEEDLFVTMEVDKEKLWLHEQAVATFSFWRAVDLWSQPNYQKPRFEGFWVEEMLYSSGKADTTTMEIRNQKKYAVTRIRYAIIPLSPGRLTIDPAFVTISIDPWSGARKLLTKPVEVTVSPLPEKGKPAEFGGMVIAKPKVLLRTSSSALKVNDSLALTLTIKGDGYLKPAAAPTGPRADWFEAFDPKLTDDMEKTGPRLQATRIVEYPLIARKEGTWEPPPIVVAWFDPDLGIYEQQTLTAGQINVAKGAAMTTTPAPAAGIGQAPQAARYIKPDRDALGDFGAARPQGPWPWLILASPGPLLGLAWWIRRKRDRLSSNLALSRRINAARNARARLNEAKTADDADKFFAALDLAVRGYLADMWDLTAPAITRETAVARLQPMDAPLAQGFDRLFSAVEMARYARPGQESMKKLADDAQSLIDTMEKVAK